MIQRSSFGKTFLLPITLDHKMDLKTMKATKPTPNASQIGKLLPILLLALLLLFSFVGCASPAPTSEDEEITLFMNNDGELRVLQFADLHFGEEGTIYHNADVARTLSFIDYAIKSEDPDFIVLLGDNMMTQGVDGAKFIVKTFDQYKIPYTLVFGNHDATSSLPKYKKSDVSEYLETCDSPYLLYKSGYVQSGREDRYGNFSISVRDKITNDLLGAFVLLDTGTYDYEKEQYQRITKEQIAWYEQEIQKLNGIYAKQESTALSTVPSITYGHIPLPEYAEAYRRAQSNDGAEFIHHQELSDHWLSYIAGDPDKAEDSFFDAMEKMQSAKAYFCGHMHGLNFHARMDGILLGFCPQSGVTNHTFKTLSTFSYTVDASFDIRLHLIIEPQA